MLNKKEQEEFVADLNKLSRPALFKKYNINSDYYFRLLDKFGIKKEKQIRDKKEDYGKEIKNKQRGYWY